MKRTRILAAALATLTGSSDPYAQQWARFILAANRRLS